MSGDPTTSNDNRPPEQTANDDLPSGVPPTAMALRIKSLEQQTKPITIPRDASVLDLKQAVQVAFQVECNRQRLIFQGKVLKDEKNLTDYANLDNGKVVHLVVRPADVPQNSQNDEPRPQSSSNNSRRTFARGIPLSRLFPLGGRPPAMEGYTFITLDVGDPGHHLSSLMDGLAGNLFPSPNLGNATRPSTGAENTNGNTRPPTPSQSSPRARARDTSANTTTTSNTTSTGSIPSSRSPFEFTLGPRSASDLGPSNPSDMRSATGVPFPPSVEVRLMRTMSCMRNVRTILDTPPDQSIHGITTASSTSPEQSQEIRSRLRGSGNSQTAAVGMVLDELATLMTDVVPRLREMSEALRASDRSPNSEENVQLYRRVLRTARVVQGMSLINHFLGSVLAAADISPSRRTRPRTPASSGSTSAATSPRASQPSKNSQPETNDDTSASTSAPAGTSASQTTDEQNDGTTSAAANNDDVRGTKRKHEEGDDPSSSSSSSSQQDKGKRRETGDNL
ncbi:hypothetical protein BDB00DRAFT_830372 [Zychaea mexicana]|uniref:uncharacterized protein n=1 Tax=Zychaea mexicana TaxID=64656 RepID=UPI0022FE1DFE|nr:uncharacterized protein BDB00DRAFT_830372 [Zychaea mexicana]KAI9491943.1 hypothetical protein BDB00DRAFT_830372 [Zychaea mexicana]